MPPLRSLVLSEVRLPLTAAQLKTRTMPASSNVVQKKMGTTQQEEVQEGMAHFAIGSLSFSKRGQRGVVKENSRIF